MATLDNERYLRHILLLGEGGLLVLRGIVTREAASSGQTLHQIILGKRAVFKDIIREQRKSLFPSPSAVNVDLKTWDMSLLMLVVKKLFWANLSPADRNSINTLRTYRVDVQGHPTEMCMEVADYNANRTDVTAALKQLASGVSQKTIDDIDGIITWSGSGSIDTQSAMQHVKELNEFKHSVLNELESKFHTTFSKLSDLDKQVNTIKGNVDILQRNQHGRHEELGTQMQGLHTAAQLSHKDLTEIKEMLSELMVQQRSQRQWVQQDIDTTMHVDSDTPENATEAQEIIIITINDILKQIRPDIMEDSNSSEAIRHLVNELLTSDKCNYYGIIKELLQLIKDIGRYGTIQQARKGSITLTVRFTSFDGLLNFIQYVSSQTFQQRLSDLSKALNMVMGHAVTLSAHIAQESLYDLRKYLEQMFPRFKEDDKEDNFGQSASPLEEDEKENDDASMLERESALPPASQDKEEDKPEDENENTPVSLNTAQETVDKSNAKDKPFPTLKQYDPSEDEAKETQRLENMALSESIIGNKSDKNEKDRLSLEKRKQCRILLNIPPNVRGITEDNIDFFDRFDTTKGILSKKFQQFITSGATDQHDKEDISKVLENSSQGKYESKLDKTVRTPDLERVRKPNQTEEDFYSYTVEEVVESFRICRMYRFAEDCGTNNLDGAFFRNFDLNALKEDPFFLRNFDIFKVRKVIKDGWRLKTSTASK